MAAPRRGKRIQPGESMLLAAPGRDGWLPGRQAPGPPPGPGAGQVTDPRWTPGPRPVPDPRSYRNLRGCPDLPGRPDPRGRPARALGVAGRSRGDGAGWPGAGYRRCVRRLPGAIRIRPDGRRHHGPGHGADDATADSG